MQHFKHALDELKAQDRLRRLPDLPQQARYIVSDGLKLLNLSSNDYLGLAHDEALRHEFLESDASARCRGRRLHHGC